MRRIASLVEVQCPHCNARGQVLIPPLGAIIIGPCPECGEYLLFFSGHLFPLDKDIMENEDDRAVKKHILGQLVPHLDLQIDMLLQQDPGQGEQAPASGSLPLRQNQEPISDAEADQFVEKELNRLDDPEAFRKIFGGRR